LQEPSSSVCNELNCPNPAGSLSKFSQNLKSNVCKECRSWKFVGNSLSFLHSKDRALSSRGNCRMNKTNTPGPHQKNPTI
jgi:hypothetical protein